MTMVKICGITRREDLVGAAEMGFDCAGFIFADSSPRRIAPDSARRLASAEEAGGMLKVGVFRDQPLNEVRGIFDFCRLDAVQLHGCEDPDYCAVLGIPFWKAVTSVESMALYRGFEDQPILIDLDRSESAAGRSPGLDPADAESAVRSARRVILAGGLSHENIGDYLALEPWGVDVCSSLEVSPGVKDHERMRILIEKVRRFDDERRQSVFA